MARIDDLSQVVILVRLPRGRVWHVEREGALEGMNASYCGRDLERWAGLSEVPFTRVLEADDACQECVREWLR